jgi:TRAP-type C4-dicarboxylate transport system permease small subunit
MKYLDRFDLILNKAAMVAGGIALMAVMVLATGNVLLRIFGVPFTGSYEIISFLGAVVTAAALGYTQRHKDHIIVDIISDRFPPGLKRAVEAVSYLVTACFFSVIAWQTAKWGMMIRESGELSETQKIMYDPFVFGVALGFAFLALACSIDLLKSLLNAEAPEAEKERAC